MSKFSTTTLEVLKIAACIGNEELSAEILAKGCGISTSQLALDLSEALEAGLIVTGDEDDDEVNGGGGEEDTAMVDISTTHSPRSYKFFHDRCQQAAYGLVPFEERSTLHYEIGKRLVNATPQNLINENIFDLANQLNHGIEILGSPEERDELARFNYLAGSKANKSTAFEAARKYLSIAWDLLGEMGWVQQYDLMSSVVEAMVEVEYSLA